MQPYTIEYWTVDNWDGDPDVLELDLDHEPTQEDVEAHLFTGIQSFRIVEAE